MGKLSIWLFAILSYTVELQGQEPFVCSFKCNNSVGFIKSNCNLKTNQIRTKPILGVNPYDEFDAVVKNLNADNSIALPLIYTFRECTSICNAAAVKIDSTQFILYNPDFLAKLGTSMNDKWAVRCIIAHEIAHHYLDHTTTIAGIFPDPTEMRKRELRADYISGYIIKKFGAPQVLNAYAGLNTIVVGYRPANAAEAAGSNYPLFKDRVQAVTDGFNNSDTALTFALLKDMEWVGFREFQRMGRSLILREADKEISRNNIKQALEQLGIYIKSLPPGSAIELMQEFQEIMNKQGGNKIPAIGTGSNPIESNKLEEWRKLYEKMKNGTPAQRLEAEQLLKKIKDMELQKSVLELPSAYPELNNKNLPTLPQAIPDLPTKLPSEGPLTLPVRKGN